jgi:3-oxoacyl-[acyl-carrier protein] reductase
MELNNKVALVLGAIKGIGKGIALALAKEGVQTALTYYDWEESLEDLQQDMAASGATYLIQKTNLRDPAAIRPLIEKIHRQYGRLDILINNIERGGWPVVHGPYQSDQWDLEIETTLKAKRWVFDAALPLLRNSGDAAVINISSIAGVLGRCGPADILFNDGYAAANRAVSLLTETWARTGAPEVRVNEIMLGLIETRHGAGTRGWGLLTESQREALIDHTLIPRLGRIDDVVKAVLFVLKDAPFMTGSILRLDGGYVLGGEKVGPMPEGVV